MPGNGHGLARVREALAPDYRIERELGAGGMATVYLAEDAKHGRKVAVKVLDPKLAASMGAERFLREIDVAANLSHPNIVPLYDSGRVEDVLFYVMPYVEGHSLRDRLKRDARIPVDEALDIATDIADGLAFAHAQGVVHRDIKPGNVLLSGVRAVITDFGIARAISAIGEDTLTRAGTTVGTPQYMSPEQASGERELDGRSDVYALGCVLYEMLAGEPPFVAASDPVLIAKHLTTRPSPVSGRRSEVSAELSGALDRALEKDPDDRFTGAAEFRDELARIRRVSNPVSHLLTAFRRPRPATALVGILAVAILVGGYFVNRSREAARTEEEVLPAIHRLVELGELGEAYALAVAAEQHIRGNALLEALWPRISTEYSVITDPPGARVQYKDYSTPDEEWTLLGRSPIRGARVPIGIFRWQIEKEGYHTLETVSATPEAASLWDTALVVTLADADTAPADMVHLPSSRRAVELSWLRGGAVVEVPAYRMDKYEVTNREFHRFVDADGYENPEYWPESIVLEEGEVTFESAMSAFRDGTGRHGPSTWEGGTFPPGKENHPVAGVSWYEAVAYAEFAGKSLPTVYHWSAAADLKNAQVIVAASNFDSATATVGAYPGLGGHGLYDMAGNVREWVWNADQGTTPMRYILGGSWADQTYAFSVADGRPPWDRSPDSGFRLMESLAGDGPPEATKKPLARSYFDFRNVTPVPDEEFEGFRERLYTYDRTPLNATVEEIDTLMPFWKKETVSFDAAYGGERVTAYLFTPKGMEPPYQTVVYFPTGLALARGDSKGLDRQQGFHSYFWDFLAMGGRAVLYPVYKGTYERQMPGGAPDSDDAPVAFRDWQIQLTKDFRRSVDFLMTRDDVDHDRLAYYGVSMGANIGPLNVALEDRLRTAVFLLGGFAREMRPEVDPVNFTPRVTIPTLMINGEHDYAFPIETSAFPMFDYLGTPEEHKEHRVYPGGHGMWGYFGHQVRGEILAWLDRYLGPVN